LTTISPDVLIPTEQDDSRPPGVISRVLVRDDLAMIPDLYEIERMVDSVLSAAPA
jgi:chemosensory pili system protein ChpC